MSVYRRPLWLYPLFQIPALLLSLLLVIALLFYLLNIGRPSVALAIALDLSKSTYGNQFNAPGTLMAQEIAAVKAYLNKNNPTILSQPNQVQIFGFADTGRPLTPPFQTQSDSQQVSQALTQALQPSLVDIIGDGSNIDLAIQEATGELANIKDRCRELLLVTNSVTSINPKLIAEAIAARVRINAIIVGSEAPDIKNAIQETGGKYLVANINNLGVLFTDQFFNRFNNNWRWVLFWLGLAWIALMWMITMPLDRWIFQGLLTMPMNLAGRLALGNALFWSTATPFILWKLYDIFNLGFPFLAAC